MRFSRSLTSLSNAASRSVLVALTTISAAGGALAGGLTSGLGEGVGECSGEGFGVGLLGSGVSIFIVSFILASTPITLPTFEQLFRIASIPPMRRNSGDSRRDFEPFPPTLDRAGRELHLVREVFQAEKFFGETLPRN